MTLLGNAVEMETHAGLADRTGFTLIELLIVVAIIGILAAIAIPNFLNAKTRAQIARVQGEQAAIATAVEQYRLDSGNYPRNAGIGLFGTELLSSPVAYISFEQRDVFSIKQEGVPAKPPYHYEYVTRVPRGTLFIGRSGDRWVSWSRGPDFDRDDSTEGQEGQYRPVAHDPAIAPSRWSVWYDATNGLRSNGDLVRKGP